MQVSLPTPYLNQSIQRPTHEKGDDKRRHKRNPEVNPKVFDQQLQGEVHQRIAGGARPNHRDDGLSIFSQKQRSDDEYGAGQQGGAPKFTYPIAHQGQDDHHQPQGKGCGQFDHVKKQYDAVGIQTKTPLQSGGQNTGQRKRRKHRKDEHGDATSGADVL